MYKIKMKVYQKFNRAIKMLGNHCFRLKGGIALV